MSGHSVTQSRRPTANVLRPNASTLQSDPSSPHTPLSRSVSGLYGSPGSFRLDEDTVLVFELGARHLSVGLSGEPYPRCIIQYAPHNYRRVGDHVGYASERANGSSKPFYEGHELWHSHMTEVNPGDLQDRLERLIRGVENQYLLLDHRQKRAALVISSLLPKTLLSAILAAIFTVVQPTIITLLPVSIMTAVGAGQRTGLIVDIGWFETTVFSVCEYRETSQRCSVRAGKLLSRRVCDVLNHALRIAYPELKKARTSLSLGEVEQVIRRGCWCQTQAIDQHAVDELPIDVITVHIFLSGRVRSLQLPVKDLSEPLEKAFFEIGNQPRLADDHNLPLPQLIYTALLRLPCDLRRLCMSRIVFTGGCSQIPGLKARILAEVRTLIKSKGWSSIKNYSSGIDEARKSNSDHLVVDRENTDSSYSDGDGELQINAVFPAVQETQPRSGHVDDSIAYHANQGTRQTADVLDPLKKPPRVKPIQDSVRAVTSLGPWQGASLITNLRIKGAVEIEKDRFWHHGLAGSAARKDGLMTMQVAKQGLDIPVATASTGTDKTLGVWT